MSTTVTLDEAGRVLIPKALLDQLRLEPGDTLELQSEGERMTLRPVRSVSRLHKEQGLWVFRSGERLSVADANKVLDDVRHERDLHNLGLSD